MMQIGLIGICAGAAAALLFASVTSGSLLSIVLFYLAPLPIMIAALGWGHWTALIAAFAGALALASVFGGVFFLAFLGSAGVPGWWLGYLTMLARPVAAHGDPAQQSNAPALEWYPPGRLVVWAAALAAMLIMAVIPIFGTDAASVHTGLRNELAQILRALELTGGGNGGADRARLLDFFIAAIPPTAAVIATIVNVLNLWLAARIARFSGRLTRPWPPLADLTFPRGATAALAAAVALTFVGGMIGIFASIASASLLMAFAVLGFAVLHAITRNLQSRAFVLGGVYAAVLVFGWPIFALCALGLAETAFHLRARVAQQRRPPART